MVVPSQSTGSYVRVPSAAHGIVNVMDRLPIATEMEQTRDAQSLTIRRASCAVSRACLRAVVLTALWAFPRSGFGGSASVLLVGSVCQPPSGVYP